MTSTAAVFDEGYYLTNNVDVVLAISQGQFASALDHYNAFGGKELRQPNATFNPTYYAINNADVLGAVSAGGFANVFSHYQQFGETESRAPATEFAGFDSAAYLTANADVAAAVTAGSFASALDHFITFGQNESRTGSGVTETVVTGSTFTLTSSTNQTTGGSDNFTGTANADTFLATADAALSNGDVIDGAGGVDTITARYAVAADTTINTSLTNVENLIIDTDEGAAAAHELNFGVAFTGLQEVRIKDAVATDAAIIDDINITSMALGVNAAVENGDGIFDVNFQYASVTGTSDAATLNLAAASVETVTIAGIETLTLTGESGSSNIATLTSTAATTLNVTGSGNVDVNNVDDATTTINAAASTGNVEMRGIGAVNTTITGGTGNDTIDMGGTLDTNDTIAGGDGTDRVVVSGSETAALASVTSIEEVELDIDDIGDGNTTTISGGAITSATKFVSRANTGTDDDEAIVAFTNLDDGDTIEFLSGGSDTTAIIDGINITTAPTTNTASNTLTLEFDGIGATSANATNDTGLSNVEVDEIETLTIVSNTNSTGAVTTNGLEELDVAVATSITLSGAADFNAGSVVNTTTLTSINSSAMTRDLTLTGLDSSALTLTDGSGNLTVTMAGLNNADTIDGGGNRTTAGDTVTALSVSGLSSTTGALNVSNVENLIIQAAGANTLDLTSVSNVGVFAISGATPGTQTLTGVASGQVIGIGEAGAVFDASAEMDVTLADATGTSDSLTFNVNNTVNANTDAQLDISNVETITLDVAAATNNAQVLVANAEASTLVAVDGGAGALLTLGTLNAATTTLTASGLDGDISFSGANATSGMTVTLAGLANADDATLSGEGDTLTVASTAGGVAMDLDGGGGTDTINVTVGNGILDLDEVDNFEVMNLTVVSGADVTAGASADEVEGIDELTTLNVLGGNSLSTFTLGGAAAGTTDLIDVPTITAINAGTFAGNVILSFGAEDFTSTTTVTGGVLTTDRILSTYDTAATIDTNTSAVETISAQVDTGNDGSENYIFDIADNTGLVELQIENATSTNTIDINNYVDSARLQLGWDLNNDGTRDAAETFTGRLDINHDAASGTGDIANVELFDTANGTTADINAAGVETLNFSITQSGEVHSIDLAGVTASASTGSVTVNITGSGTDGVTVTTASSTVDTIDGSGMAGVLTITDRDASAMTITGGSAGDTIRMESGSDVLTGGSGTDTLNIVQNAVLGGFAVDLSSSSDQVTTYNGAANTAVQSGFESADLSGVTGGFGAAVTAASTGSTITGTLNADVITGGAGADTLLGGAGADSITAGDGGGRITGGSEADTIVLGGGADEVLLDYTLDSATNFDTISGFTSGTDKLLFSAADIDGKITGTPITSLINANIDTIVGTELGTSAATSVLIAANAAALINSNVALSTDTQTIVYLTDVAEVYVNDDGNIANGFTKVADLGSNVTLAVTDFLFIA